MFQDLLPEKAIGVGLRALDRDEALRELIELLPEDLGSQQKEKIFHLLLHREQFGTTAIGEGIALPHCIFPGVSFPLASLGISGQGIHFSSLDGGPVYVIFLLVLPKSQDWDHEKKMILRLVENLLRDRFLLERLKISETPEEAYEILVRESPRAFPSFK